jgi:hypothetical protein
MKKLCCYSLLIFISTATFAKYQAPSIFPGGCKVSGYGFKYNKLVLYPKGRQAFYLIYNHSNEPVIMEHVPKKRNGFMSPMMKTTLDPENWAGLATDINKIRFVCYKYDNSQIEAENPNAIPLSCNEILDVCEYPYVRFADTNHGTYWTSTNKTRTEVINDTTRKGIYLRWKK